MKKIALLLSAVLSPFLLWSKPLVFATPAEEPFHLAGKRWVQKLQERRFIIGLSEDTPNSHLPFHLEELTPMLELDSDKSAESLTKEYCFLYPILPSKIDKLRAMFQNPEEYWNQQVLDIYRYRGISKMQLWIQDDTYLIIYQEITGPVKEARNKYLASKEEEFNKARAALFSEVTGLSYEELLPKLESLCDGELLD